jgi:DNA-binding transcriptional ArsR family regulator
MSAHGCSARRNGYLQVSNEAGKGRGVPRAPHTSLADLASAGLGDGRASTSLSRLTSWSEPGGKRECVNVRGDFLVARPRSRAKRSSYSRDHADLGTDGSALRVNGVSSLRTARTAKVDPARDGAERALADVEGVFCALAHSSRRQILLVLKFRGGEMSAGDIAARFSCSWPTTTRHLRVLTGARLVCVEKRGRERVYRLDADRLLAIMDEWLKWFRHA